MRSSLVIGAALCCASTPAYAQEVPPISTSRVDENAIREAEDAFGVSIGDETIGIYTTTEVRGFSPTRANNVRIDGLYFDQVWAMNPRVRRASTIRVGMASLGFAFPAPTGVVDYALRKPGNDASLSVAASFDSFAGASIEADGVVPIIEDKLSLSGGVAASLNQFNGGNSNVQHIAGANLRWTPAPDVEILPFWSRSDTYDYEMSRTYIPAGPYLPPKAKRGRFFGPGWATFQGSLSNYGATARYDLSGAWQIRAGLFRSEAITPRDHYVFLTDILSDGSGRSRVLGDPPSAIRSTSGEVRLSYQFKEGPRHHRLHTSIRARDRSNRYGGGFSVDLGPSGVDIPSHFPEPEAIFGTQSHDRMKQQTYGLAYEGRWINVGEINLGLQRTYYSKTTQVADGLPTQSRDNPWLFNAAIALNLRDNLALYGGYTRGLEESGTAPSNASNRNAVLPAIITSQRDAGLRWTISPGVRMIAGVFDVRKPYFNLDANNAFVLLGNVQNRGIEVSLSGAVTPRLDIVAGGVLSRPRVTGEGVALGRLGPIPVDVAARRIDVNLDWRPPNLEGLSLDANISHSGRILSTRDNLVAIPARTLVDLGGRYRFKLGEKRASLRLSVSNIFNVYSWTLRSAGAYLPIDGRRLTLRIIMDM